MRALVPSEKSGEQLTSAPDQILDAINSRISVLGVQPLLVINPLTPEMECVRTTTLSNMLETVRNNLRFHDKDVMLFEIGKIYLPRGEQELPDERRIITVGTGAYRSGGNWGEKQEISFFEIKAIAEAVLERFGISTYSFLPITHPTFREGRTAAIILGHELKDISQSGLGVISQDDVAGVLGEIDDHVRENFDLDQRAYLMALDFEVLSQRGVRVREFKPIPRFPAIEEDIAVVVDTDVPAELVQQTIQQAGGSLVRSVSLFDLYQGEKIPAGKKSLAYHIVYQAVDRTLTDQEINAYRQRIEETLAKDLGATFRR
jgi:phenylalanyl-tRNA synthetase beta chain